MMALAITACTDTWDDHYTVNSSVGSNTTETLWDLIAADSTLSQFAEQLKRAGYDTLLSQSRYYTVWAPVNGFLDNATEDGVLDNDTLLKTEFLQNHIADYSHIGNGTLEKKIKMLNKKLINFAGNSQTGYTIRDIAITTANIPAKNGILHRIGGDGQYITFSPNIWEYLEKNDSIADFSNYLRSFTKKEINKEESVVGPLVDGKVTYLLEVLKEENIWWEHIGDFTNEDSSYTVIVPTNRAWREMYDKAKTYFVMDERYKATRDSLQEYNAKFAITRHLSFSNTMQKNEGRDSLVSNYANLVGGERYAAGTTRTVFRGEEKDMLFANEIEQITLSNGTIHIVDQLNYSPFKCWHDTISISAAYAEIAETEDANQLAMSSYTGETYTAIDSVKNTARTISYLKVAPRKTSGDTQATFTLGNYMLSANYRIKLVLVPAICEYKELLSIYTQEELTELLKPNKFEVKLYYPNEKGTKKNQKLGNYIYQSWDPLKMDTIVLNPNAKDAVIGSEEYVPEDYIFSSISCEALLDTETPAITTLEIKSDVSSKELRDGVYDRTLRIAQIILEPVE